MQFSQKSAVIIIIVCALWEPAAGQWIPKYPNPHVLLDPPETCYDVVGCFSNRAPWETLRRPVFPPRVPEQISPHMYFHNRQTKARNGTKFQIFPDVNFSNIPFDVEKQTFLIAHGYTEYGTKPIYTSLAKALLRQVDANVFVLEYSGSSRDTNYFQVASDVRVAGRLGAIVMLKAGFSPVKLHLIGHSLGAQLLAYTANYITEKKGKPARLTSLEPAKPLFESFGNEVKQDKTDAEFVDVVHTSIGKYGYWLSSGHTDFFVGGGVRQPGCKMENLITIGLCSHKISVILYIKSLERNGCILGGRASLIAPKALLYRGYLNGSLHCGTKECASMGLGIEKIGKTGHFFVPTNKPPHFICNDNF